MTEPAVGTFSRVAAVLSEILGEDGAVTDRQVHAWWSRRANNGFPEAAGKVRGANGRRESWAFDLAAVIEWYGTYEPRKGGAPRGNRNGLKHGRYVGRRAAGAKPVDA